MGWLIAYGIGVLVTVVFSGIMGYFNARNALLSTGVVHFVMWKHVAFNPVIWPVFWPHLIYVFFNELVFGD